MPRSRLMLVSQPTSARVKVVDVLTSSSTTVDTEGAVSFAGDVAWAPNRSFAWLHSGVGSGNFQLRSLDCRIYTPSGSSWVASADLDIREDPPGEFHRWSSMCFHRSGDLFLANAMSVEVDRYAPDGTFITSYLPAITAGTMSEIHVVDDVIYYFADSKIKRYQVGVGQLADAVASTTLVDSIDVDRNGRVLLARGTSGADLYNSAGTLVTSFNLGASSHHSAAFDDDGRSVWIAYGRYVHNLRISDGVSLGVFDTASTVVDSIAMLPGRRAGRGEWFARGEP